MERGLDDWSWGYDGGGPDWRWDTADDEDGRGFIDAHAPGAGWEESGAESGRRLLQRLKEYVRRLKRGRGRKAEAGDLVIPLETSMDALRLIDLQDRDTIIGLLYEAGWREDGGPRGRERFHFSSPKLLRHGGHQDLAFNVAPSTHYDADAFERLVFCPVSKKLATTGDAPLPEPLEE